MTQSERQSRLERFDEEEHKAQASAAQRDLELKNEIADMEQQFSVVSKQFEV